MKKGKLIVIEGACDGIGKTTQYNLLKEKLKQEGENILSHHFPSYNTYQGKPVEEYLKGNLGSPKDLSPYFINCLYATDRAITWEKDLKKEYDKGSIILLDRYTTSSLIYQSALIEDSEEKKQFIDYVIDFEYEKLGIAKPDNVIFLTAPLELVNSLRQKRKEEEGEAISGDIHEKDLAFQKKVYENALFIADYLNWDVIECTLNGKMKSKEDIHEEIYKYVRKKKKVR